MRGTRPSLAGAERIGRGEFVRRAYRLGRMRATGVLTVEPVGGDPSVLVLRRGCLLAGGREAVGHRTAVRRLERLAAAAEAWLHFDGGLAVYPPGAFGRQLPLAAWARRHLEAQLDAGGARRLQAELAGARLSVRPELAPDASLCDETDLRILEAMRTPRRLEQIWPLARTPRFRLLAFVHFLRGVGALDWGGVAAPRAEPVTEAHRVLGVPHAADRETLKRAYRRLARALHPDLHPEASEHRRRSLEERLARVNRAYRDLLGG